jgi:hypothetical protein
MPCTSVAGHHEGHVVPVVEVDEQVGLAERRGEGAGRDVLGDGDGAEESVNSNSTVVWSNTAAWPSKIQEPSGVWLASRTWTSRSCEKPPRPAACMS